MECLLCWTLRKILPIGFLLDGQYLIETLFSQLNLKPSERYLLKTMTDIFLKTGHGMTDMAIYFTDFNIQLATNLDLNSLIFSNYKNTVTGKALIGFSAHGAGLLFSDAFSKFNK